VFGGITSGGRRGALAADREAACRRARARPPEGGAPRADAGTRTQDPFITRGPTGGGFGSGKAELPPRTTRLDLPS
jgi:hypothetical protein